jgi:2',3'-cyclic-nucleotide 2'-phosphodiesterase (5'-nucleotidase family)
MNFLRSFSKARFTVSLIILSVFSFAGCKPKYTITRTEYVFSDSTDYPVDSSVYEFIQPYKQRMEGEMNTVLAESDSAMQKGVPESKLGNFVADACMSETKKIYYPTDGKQPDFAFLNNGGLRRPLPSGKITRGDVFELMPFENELVVLTLDGKLVKKIFNFIASKDGAPVSGVRFKISHKEAIEIMIDGKPLDTLRTYKALTSDYLANGGDSFTMLSDEPRENTNLKVRDAIINYLVTAGKAGKKISVMTDGRIIDVQ